MNYIEIDYDFDEITYHKFKLAFLKAKMNDKEIFQFDGYDFTIESAAKIVEYLDNKFGENNLPN